MVSHLFLWAIEIPWRTVSHNLRVKKNDDLIVPHGMMIPSGNQTWQWRCLIYIHLCLVFPANLIEAL